VHIVAARLGHADPAVSLRAYSHVLREHALCIGDIFARAIEAHVSKSVSKPDQENRWKRALMLARLVVRGQGRTADLPFRIKDDRPGVTMPVYGRCSEPGARR
jgi:hypothetical protein